MRTTVCWRISNKHAVRSHFGTNITPDRKTGIRVWSLEAFIRAMREGVARDGSHLMPAFPYYAFTKLSDDDVKGLYAYLMTRPAVNSTVPTNTLPFPLNIGLFRKDGRFCFSGARGTEPISPRATNGIAERI
jgi:nicotinate dehydrogenase subunit B